MLLQIVASVEIHTKICNDNFMIVPFENGNFKIIFA